MEHKPVPGQEPLAPPSPEIAQQYLDHAQAVAGRRGYAVDRRALAWLQIANALVTGVYLTALAGTLQRGIPGETQIVLFTFLVWTQLASGMAQRSGMQWRMTRSRWPSLVGAVLLGLGALVLFGFAAFDPDLPPLVTLLPGVIVLVGFGGHGLVQLVRAPRGPRAPRTARTPLSPWARRGTVLVGVAMGALALLASAQDGVITSVLVLLVALLLLAWILAARTELGLPGIGAVWRWPHVTAFALSASALLALVVADRGADGSSLVAGAVGGAGIVLLFVAVSFLRGRDVRD